jgi:hypothetical protein
MKQALIYSLKVWFTMVVLSPVIPVLFLEHHSRWSPTQYLTEYYWSGVGEVLVFLPVLILLIILTVWVNKKPIRMIRKKVIIQLSSTVLLWLMAYVVVRVMAPASFSWRVAITYSIWGGVLAVGIWVYKLKEVDPAPLS